MFDPTARRAAGLVSCHVTLMAVEMKILVFALCVISCSGFQSHVNFRKVDNRQAVKTVRSSIYDATVNTHFSPFRGFSGKFQCAERKMVRCTPLHMRRASESWIDAGLDRIFLGSTTTDADKTKVETPSTSSEDKFVLLVMDDDEHTVDEVIKILRKTIHCSWLEALRYTWQIGTNGKGIVFEGGRQECEQAQKSLSRDKIASKVLTVSEAEADAANEASAAPPITEKSKPDERPSWGRSFRNGPRPRVTVVGGTGRVGMWTIRELHRFAAGDIDFVIAGRNAGAAARLCRQLRGEPSVFGGREWSTMRVPHRGTAEFRAVSLEDQQSIVDAVAGSDLGKAAAARWINPCRFAHVKPCRWMERAKRAHQTAR